jgi:hypothetical protein
MTSDFGGGKSKAIRSYIIRNDYTLVFFTGLHAHLKRLNMKLQGFEKPKTVMLSIVKAHEKNVT